MSNEPIPTLQVKDELEDRDEIEEVQVSHSTGDKADEITIVCASDVVDRCFIEQLEDSHPVIIENVAADPADAQADLDNIRGPNIPTCVVFYAIYSSEGTN